MTIEISKPKSQASMDDQFVREYMDAVGVSGDFNEFLADWGMSEEEVIDYLETNPKLLPEGYSPHYEGDVGEIDKDDREDDQIMNDEFVPDYSKTAEYEGINTDEVKLGSLDINPALAGMLGGKGQALRKGASALANKIFASPALKANQLTNRGVVGNVVTGTSRTAANTGLRPAITQKAADKYATMAGNVAKKNATKVAAGTTAAAIVGGAINNSTDENPKTQSRNLKGNRDADGTLKDAIRFTHANGSYAFAEPGSDLADELMAQEYFAGDIAGQNAGKSQSNTGSDWANAEIDDEIGVEEPTGPDMPETMGNQFGYHKQEGQNFWTVNNDDPYWDTHVMGTGDAWSDADAKEEVQELDWSSWFK